LQVSADLPSRRLELNQKLEETQAIFVTAMQQMPFSMPSSNQKTPNILQLLPELLNVLRNSSLTDALRMGIERISGALGRYWAGLAQGIERLRGNVTNTTREAQALAHLRAFLQMQDQKITLALAMVSTLLQNILRSLPAGGGLATLTEPLLRLLEQGGAADHILATDALFGEDAHFCENLPPVLAFFNRCNEFASTSFPNFITSMRAQISTVLPLLSIMAPDIANVARDLTNAFFSFSEDMIGPMANAIQLTVSTVGNIATNRLNCTGLNVNFIGTSGGSGGNNTRGDFFWPNRAAAAPRAAAVVGLVMLGWAVAAWEP